MQSPGIKGMLQLAIAASDPAKLSAYYRETLGLSILFETAGMSFFGAGGVRLMIGPAQGAKAGDKILYFEPEDFEAAEAALEANGVKFPAGANVLQREGERELALRPFQDPEGNTLALMGWRPVSSEAVRG
ncbi:MAG: VOC family protein [Hyphomonadaceae bacterium]|nr:VOC family protein [Hyphomonadaceae bacterium]